LKKECDGLSKKEEFHVASLKDIDNEIRAHRLVKLKKINQLPAWIPLRAHQINFHRDGKLMMDFKDAIVIEERPLLTLAQRIEGIQTERDHTRQVFRDLKKRFSVLLKEKEEREEQLSTLEQKLCEVQVLKFGKTVNLDKLEMIGTHRGSEEIREQLGRFEKTSEKQLKELNVSFCRFLW
jgi:hypothetical protein